MGTGYGGVDELKAERDGTGGREERLGAVGSAAGCCRPRRDPLEEEEEEEERALVRLGSPRILFRSARGTARGRQEKRRAKEELKRKRQATLERAREKLARLRDQEAEERAAPTEAACPRRR